MKLTIQGWQDRVKQRALKLSNDEQKLRKNCIGKIRNSKPRLLRHEVKQLFKTIIGLKIKINVIIGEQSCAVEIICK